MTRQEIFQTAGEALFGDSYRVRMNVALAARHPDGPKDFLDGRMIARWSDGRMDVPDWVMASILILLRERESETERLLEALRQLAKETTREVNLNE